VANAGNDTCIKPGNSVTIGTAGHSEYLYWWYDEHGNLVDTPDYIDHLKSIKNRNVFSGKFHDIPADIDHLRGLILL
jgi:hypothetical protein